jgi:hypothetical protein
VQNLARVSYVVCILLLFACGCGGDNANFTNSVYIEIKPGGTLQPQAMASMNGYRVVFLNHDTVAHTINWDAPLTLSAVAPPNDRAWFDLPALPVGTVLHYHLDSSGASGTVTVAQSLSWPSAVPAVLPPGSVD